MVDATKSKRFWNLRAVILLRVDISAGPQHKHVTRINDRILKGGKQSFLKEHCFRFIPSSTKQIKGRQDTLPESLSDLGMN